MGLLHPLSDLLSADPAADTAPTYWYEGDCPRSRRLLRLPRTALAEQIARQLMQQLAGDDQFSREGKMYGVLLVENSAGELQVLKAFSGLLNGRLEVEGWVPPIAGREQVTIAEKLTLNQLEAIKQELIQLQDLPERSQLFQLSQQFASQLQDLTALHSQRKQERNQKRQELSDTLDGEELLAELERLEEQSRRDGMERRDLKRDRDRLLQPLKAVIDRADDRIRTLKQQRRELSRRLQTQMHESYRLTNFAGESFALQSLMPDGLPTGTGECCAPKLLNYAALHQLRPLAMAEFWWGATTDDRRPGEFYGACADRCQPLMGFLLSGLLTHQAAPLEPQGSPILPMLYEDQWFVAVNKPAGLLSVPGRYHDRQDSVLSRLKVWLPGGESLIPIHRLDQDTSGVLLLARDGQTYRQVSQQFHQRQVQKVYEAVLAGNATSEAGVIHLPLAADPHDRPRQVVNWQSGRPSTTHFRVLRREDKGTRIEFIPVTGRTHQIRVHAADPQGLKVPIAGDRLYGNGTVGDRLHLHARQLTIRHPQSGQPLCFTVETPF